MSYLINQGRIVGIMTRYNQIANLIQATTARFSDPFVGYHLSIAYDSFMLEFYESTILFSGLAIEEALVAVYSVLTVANPSMRYLGGSGKPVNAEGAKFSPLIKWARGSNVGLITTAWGVDDKAIDAIRESRNFFAHSHRTISKRIKNLLASGYFTSIFPMSVTGAAFAISKPVLGQLFTMTTAETVLDRTISILQKIDAFLQSKGSSL